MTYATTPAGRRRCRLALQRDDRDDVGIDAYGRPVADWRVVAYVWGSVEPLSGRELWQARQVQADVSLRVRIPYPGVAAVGAAWRLLHRGRILNVLAPIQPSEMRAEWELMCGEAPDSSAFGTTPLLPVLVATTADLSALASYANGAAGVGAALTALADGQMPFIDGARPTTGDRVLVKDQVAELENGVYAVTQKGDGDTPWVLTRVAEFDSPGEITAGRYVWPTGGGQAGRVYVAAPDGTVAVGTTAIPFERVN